MRRCALPLLLTLAAGPPALAQSPSQSPWTVTVQSTMDPLPIGFCAAVRLDILDPKLRDIPRNPAGARVTIADFDMRVTTPGAAVEVAGQHVDAYHWSVCGCQAGTKGTVATITASYPARGLPSRARVPGVTFTATGTVTLAAAKGTVNAPSCGAPPPVTVAAAPPPSLTPLPPAPPPPAKTAVPPAAPPPAPIARAGTPKTLGAVVPPAPVNPAGFTAVQIGLGQVRLSWQPVSGVAYYGLFGPGVTSGGEQLMAGTTSFTATAVPGGTQQWSVGSYYMPGQVATAMTAFPKATVYVTEPDNPAGVSARQTGPGKVELSWQPVANVAYYGLFGPGVAGGGEQVMAGTTTFTATGVPVGSQEWSVGSYYMPGQIATAMTAFPKVKVMVTDLVLSGWVDLHTHPMVHLAFGGKLIHGGVDVGSLLPADVSCQHGVRATSMAQALSDDRPSHGGWNLLHFPCGDDLRKLLLNQFQSGNHALTTASPANGFPNFDQWPKWNDITHQKMWFEWIKRAHDGGLRVMVALATNNKTLADAMSGGGIVGGNPDGPTDDKASADLQLAELEAFVKRHPDFMEVAYGSADIKRIVQAGKIAVVLGVEIDNIGNFNTLPMANLPANAVQVLISDEIQRLYNLGARYIFPVHVLDNAFGGTAIYEGGFNTSNRREAGHYWDIECADVSDNITHTYQLGTDVLGNILKSTVALVKLGIDPFMHPGPPPVCPGGQSNKSFGHRNARGLTPNGAVAIREMMKRGMIIDIDHMSQKTADETLTIAEQFGYPVVSGHTGIRGQGGSKAENSRTPRQMERLSRLHGMFGLGSDGATANSWAGLYQTAMINMGYMNSDPQKANYQFGAVSFGTDLNGLVKGPRPGGGTQVKYGPAFPMSTTMTRSWNYNTEGVAHYGMLTDFLVHVRTAAANGYRAAGGTPLGVTGDDLVNNHLFRSANYFWQMWERIEARKAGVP